MKRKIVIDKCKDCPFVMLYHCKINNDKAPKDQYFCNGDGFSADVGDVVDGVNIPEWCPLEKDE